MGRPRLEAGVRKDKQVRIRMNNDEIDALDELCVYCNCDRAVLIRTLITKIHDDIFGGEANASNS